MKKLTVLLLSLLLLAAMMATPVFATGNGAAAVTGTTVNAGETAYVSISLSGFEKADTIGIQFTPASGLKLDVDKSQWELDGTLDNVDIKNFAAWCEDSAVDVNTKVLTLAFTCVAAPKVVTTYALAYEALMEEYNAPAQQEV